MELLKLLVMGILLFFYISKAKNKKCYFQYFSKEVKSKMIIQGKNFPDGTLVIYTNYSISSHAGADGCFQIVDICIENHEEKSILKKLKINFGKHYFNIKDVLNDLNVDIKIINYREETV